MKFASCHILLVYWGESRCLSLGMNGHRVVYFWDPLRWGGTVLAIRHGSVSESIYGQQMDAVYNLFGSNHSSLPGNTQVQGYRGIGKINRLENRK